MNFFYFRSLRPRKHQLQYKSLQAHMQKLVPGVWWTFPLPPLSNELNLTLSAASICCKWRHLMWAGRTHDWRVNFSPSDDSSAFFLTSSSPKQWGKAHPSVCKIKQVEKFPSCLTGMNSAWAGRRRAFLSRPIILKSACGQRAFAVCTF